MSFSSFLRAVPTRSARQRRSARAGFSLVEVAMALGVIGFGLIALLGMIPVGLSTFRDAVDETAKAQIAQQVISNLQMTNFSVLSANTQPTTYNFDNQTQPVPTSTNPVKYVATVTIVQATTLPGNTQNAHSVTALIQVQTMAKAGNNISYFVTYVADNGR